MLQRKLQHLAFTVAVSAIATAGLTLAGTKPVLAEFQIQEAGIEKGEVEIEYRGAYHWGVPEATEENENANDLVQSHDLELQMGISDWWIIQPLLGFDQGLHELIGRQVQSRSRPNSQLIKREGNGIAVSFQLAMSWAQRHKHLDDGEQRVRVRAHHRVRSRQVPADHEHAFSQQMGDFAETRKASASNMAGAANTTSPSIGAWASRCSARSRICQIPGPSTIRITVSVRPCSGSPAAVTRRGGGRRRRGR